MPYLSASTGAAHPPAVAAATPADTRPINCPREEPIWSRSSPLSATLIETPASEVAVEKTSAVTVPVRVAAETPEGRVKVELLTAEQRAGERGRGHHTSVFNICYQEK